MCFKIFQTKAELFHLIKKILNKTKTFWFVPEFFKTIFPTGSLTKPLTAFKTSQGLYRHSHGLYWHSHGSTDTLTASTDTLTASKSLLRPLQSTSTQLACNREFTSTCSRLWECCWGRESVVYSLFCNSLIEGFGSGSRSIPLTNRSGSVFGHW